MAAQMDLSSLEKDPRLSLYTSLTAGSSHIITATSRMETILKANKIPFQAIDLATDEKARRLWQRRAGKRKLPGLVKEGYVLGDLEEIEEWNEFGELKDNIGPVPDSNAAPQGGQSGVNIAPPISVNPTATGGTTNVSQQLPGGINKAIPPLVDKSKMRPLPGAAEIAAKNEPQAASSLVDEPPKVETMSSAPADKEQSISEAKEVAMSHPAIEHSSAPPSALHSDTVTPTAESAVEAPATGQAAGAAATESGGEEAKDASTATAKAENKTIPESDESEEDDDDDDDEEDEEDDDDDDDDNDDDSAAKAVQGLQVGEGTKVQEQKAAEGEEAGKSVED
ncbi:hypothetical protein LTR85_008555 [Meristemomyces frigidus]|nr:hypothetical protein LTR85_008555 [Meristemomyces frigidus]